MAAAAGQKLDTDGLEKYQENKITWPFKGSSHDGGLKYDEDQQVWRFRDEADGQAGCCQLGCKTVLHSS